jgi:hypothetical protein
MGHGAHDALWIGKVQTLLCFENSQQNNTIAKHSNYEAQIVGLLLLTRIHNTDEFLRIFTRYITTPHSIVGQWLYQEHPLTWADVDDESLLSESSLQCMFVRLLTQLLHRWLVLQQDDPSALIRSPRHEESMIHHKMMHSIVQYSFYTVTKVSAESIPSSRLLLQLEVLSCVRIYVQLSFCATAHDDSLEQLVEPIWMSMSIEAAPTMPDQPITNNEADVQSNSLMLRTMHSLLNQTTVIDEDILLDDVIQPPSWIVIKVSLQFLLEYCILILNHREPSNVAHSKPMPKCIPFLLETWIHRRSKSSIKNSLTVPLLLAHFVLTALQLCLVRWQAVESPIPLHQLLQENGIAFSDVLQLLLASVVATEPSEVDVVALDALRTTAWSCVGCILAGFGGESFLSSREEASSRWGIARPLCTILRLAVGEYKIQWTLLLDQEEELELREPNDKATSPALLVNSEGAMLPTLPQWTILESCAETIVATVRFLMRLADQIDDVVPVARIVGISGDGNEAINLPPEAILHMQQSIQDAHLVTMQCLLHAGFPVRDTNEILTHIHNVIYIFAMVISEIDVFLVSTWKVAASSVKMSDARGGPIAVSVSQQLQAVYVSISHHVIRDIYKDDVDLHVMVASCLLKVLASAEGDSDLICLLRESNILGESLVSFMDRCFRCCMNMNHASSVVDLCDIMELSVRLGERNSDLSFRYQSFIIEYLRHNLSDFDHLNPQPFSEEAFRAFHALAQCYISLQNDGEVPVLHASILQSVLELRS